MPVEDLQRIREVFESATLESGRDREAYLAKACADDPELRSLVDQMIAADAEPHSVLDQPLHQPQSDTNLLAPGYAIGQYRILRGIASGGMGAVYLACAEEQESQPVALKILRGFSLNFVRRFEQERKILTRLNHPNIARFLDAGVTPENHPYLVMEYVEGVAVDIYCAQNKLDVRQRIALMRHICAAVNYLHQNLVIHRDLKPSNILVTEDGAVKLLDFGIAKLLDEAGSTETLTGLMTPGYASPEQVRGQATSTLTDVYGLGVLLYELLTDSRPFAVAETDFRTMLRRICEEDPPPPGSINKAVNSELDNIVLKAVRKEPQRRYASVEQFDEDLRRYLSGLPVVAQGDSLAYRVRKFCARHKAALAASIGIAAAVAAGVVTTGYEARVAQAERNRAEDHARAAENARAAADAQAAEADRQRAHAEAEKSNAVRRLSELEKVARAAVGIYASAGTAPPDAAAAQIAQTARDSVAILQSEGIREPRMAEISEQALNDSRAYALARDPKWHVPAGWNARQTIEGEYQVSMDPSIVHSGNFSLFFRSLVAQPTGTVTIGQSFRSAEWRGKRVRVSGYFRGSRVNGAARLYLSGVEQVTIGTSPRWKKELLVADVPSGIDLLEIGMQLLGTGTIWADDLTIDVVPRSVPLTRQTQPQNLNFANKP